MLGNHTLGTITEVRRLATKLHDGCVCTMHCPAVHLKLKLVPVSDYIKNMEYTYNRQFIEV